VQWERASERESKALDVEPALAQVALGEQQEPVWMALDEERVRRERAGELAVVQPAGAVGAYN
jgi:hypothetical protein